LRNQEEPVWHDYSCTRAEESRGLRASRPVCRHELSQSWVITPDHHFPNARSDELALIRRKQSEHRIIGKAAQFDRFDHAIAPEDPR
jgi:hypothetical protein